MIIETAANQFFQVRPAHVDHAWIGFQVKRTKEGFAPKAKAREILVRKAGSKIIQN